MSGDEDDEKMAEFDIDEDFPNVGSDEEPDLEDKDVYPGDRGIDATDEQYRWCPLKTAESEIARFRIEIARFHFECYYSQQKMKSRDFAS